LTLYNGGTLYIDGGAPTAAGFATTRMNLAEIATTAYFNVPKGYEMLLPALGDDAGFRRQFFSRVKMLFYAAAGLRQQTADAIEALAVEATGDQIPWVTGLGATETAPFAMCTGPMIAPVAGRIGVPVPGVELKAAGVDGRIEGRVRGPNVTPGYWRDAALTASAFDEDGFYRLGDAIDFVDPSDPSRGFTFEGRLLEDFKLSTGTWVRVGPLRAALVAQLGELVQDIAIAGHDRDEVGLLIFPNVASCRRLARLESDATVAAVLGAAPIVEAFSAALRAFDAGQSGSASRVARAILIDEPPSLDAQETTDKGSLNQRAVLRRRAHLIAQLYGEAPISAIVIEPFGRRSTL
jgi:feruloyl-CoA synthase